MITWFCLVLVLTCADVTIGYLPSVADYPPIFLDEPFYILKLGECDITNDGFYSKVIFHGFINLAKMTSEDRKGGLITLNFRTHVFFDFSTICVLWMDVSKPNICERKWLSTTFDNTTLCYCGAIRELIVPIHVTTQYQPFFVRAKEIMLHWTSFGDTGTISSPPMIAKIPKYGYYVNHCAHQPRVIIPFSANYYPAYSKNDGSRLWISPVTALLIILPEILIKVT